MSDGTLSAPDPRLLQETVFDEAFKPVSGEDRRELGQVFSALNRLAGMPSQYLRLGPLQRMSGWGGGDGFALSAQRTGGYSLRFLEEVTAWSEVGIGTRQSDGTHASAWPMPLFMSRFEVMQFYEDSRFVDWYAVRSAASNLWTQHNKRFMVERENIKKTLNCVQQLDIILRSQHLPRSRMRLAYENGRLCFWTSRKRDILVSFLAKNISPTQLAQAIRMGEAFLLT